METGTAPPPDPDHDITATYTDDGCYVSAPLLVVEKNDRVKIKKRGFGPGADVKIVFQDRNPFNAGTSLSDNTFSLNLNEQVTGDACDEGDPGSCEYTYDIVVDEVTCGPPSAVPPFLPKPITPPKMIIRP